MPLSFNDKMENNTKKISQCELRKFMSAHKRKAVDSTKKIESPLAKYPYIAIIYIYIYLDT